MPSLDPVIRLSWQPESGGQETPFEDWERDRVVSFSYTDKSSGADEGKLVLENGDLRLLDSEIVKCGTKITVQWGYPHESHEPRTLEVRERKGFRTITVSGAVSNASSFIGSQKNRTWESSTPFEVAEEIAREKGFVSDDSRDIYAGDVVVPRRGIIQSSETDMAFLLRLARDVGCVFYISGEVFHFHERSLEREPTRTLTFWTDRKGVFISEPEVTVTTVGRSGGVRRSGHSPRERNTVSGSASNTEDRRRPVLGEEVSVSQPDDFRFEEWNVDYVEGQPVSQQLDDPSEPDTAQAATETTTAESDDEANSEARQQFRRAERSSIKLSATFIGLPWLEADTNVRLEGLGEELSGNYNAKEVVHDIGKGYTTKVTFERNASSRTRGTSARRSRNRVANTPSTSYVPDPYDQETARGRTNIDSPDPFGVREVSHGLDESGRPVSVWEAD